MHARMQAQGRTLMRACRQRRARLHASASVLHISQILNVDEVFYTAFAPLRLKLVLAKVSRLRCPAPSLRGIGIWTAGSLVCVTILISVITTIKVAPQVVVAPTHTCVFAWMQRMHERN